MFALDYAKGSQRELRPIAQKLQRFQFRNKTVCEFDRKRIASKTLAFAKEK